jgi:hypothetical protein
VSLFGQLLNDDQFRETSSQITPADFFYLYINCDGEQHASQVMHEMASHGAILQRNGQLDCQQQFSEMNEFK